MLFEKHFKTFIQLIVYLSRYSNVQSIFLECPTCNLTFHKCFVPTYYFNAYMFYLYCKHGFPHVFEKPFENIKMFKNQSPIKFLFKTFLKRHLDIFKNISKMPNS